MVARVPRVLSQCRKWRCYSRRVFVRVFYRVCRSANGADSRAYRDIGSCRRGRSVARTAWAPISGRVRSRARWILDPAWPA